MRGALAGVAAGLLLVAPLAGCSGLEGTGEANYTTGTGLVTQVAVDDRQPPVEISGESLDGEPIDLADLRGQVVVLNVWGSWCTPCRAEAPVLQEASEQLDAEFVGLSFLEKDFENARIFEREFSITYPTVADQGEQVLALGRYVPQSPPTTYVLDREGRVAALITGELTSVRTLEGMIEDAVGSGGPGAGDG